MKGPQGEGLERVTDSNPTSRDYNELSMLTKLSYTVLGTRLGRTSY